MRPELLALGACALLMPLLSACRSGGGQARRPDAQEAYDANDVGTVVAPADATEREVLARLPGLADGEPATIATVKVQAEPAYTAASGRRCRQVKLAPPAGGPATETRLACTDGDEWYFVPDVFRGAEAEPALGGQ